MSTQSGATIVEIRNVTKRFPGPARGADVVALDAVTLDVGEGEFLALLGPSGCGKTTLLRILAGQETPTAGEVIVDGREMAGVPPEKRPVNMVFQTPALFPHLDVFENVAFGPRMNRLPTAEISRRVAEVLELVRLRGLEKRSVTQLSGGQAQRVALARALINRPRVLLLDEPLSALDLNLRRAMQLELKGIHGLLGTTFIYVTHDQEEAITMADRIVIMDQGRLVQAGSPFEIYHRPVSVFASRFIGESNVLKGTVVEVGQVEIVVDVEGVRVHAVAVDGLRSGDGVWIAIRPERITIGREGLTNGPNRLPAEITDSVFLGVLVRYQVRLGNGIALTVTESFQEQRPIWSPGTSVEVNWLPEQSHVLRS